MAVQTTWVDHCGNPSRRIRSRETHLVEGSLVRVWYGWAQVRRKLQVNETRPAPVTVPSKLPYQAQIGREPLIGAAKLYSGVMLQQSPHQVGIGITGIAHPQGVGQPFTRTRNRLINRVLQDQIRRTRYRGLQRVAVCR